jgi:hypothetical protein
LRMSCPSTYDLIWLGEARNGRTPNQRPLAFPISSAACGSTFN